MSELMRLVEIFSVMVLGISCGHYTPPLVSGTALGEVDKRLTEASGLVASINNPGYFWTLNDSGNKAEIFLIDQHAQIRLACTLTGASNGDWEDIGIDQGEDGKAYLYIADIGDNFSKKATKVIYRLEEPVAATQVAATQTEIVVDTVDRFQFSLSDGPHDAEAILIDPKSHELFVVSKSPKEANLYKAPYPLTTGSMTFTNVGTFPLGQIVAGNISADGDHVLLKSYQKVYYWKRTIGQPLASLLTMPAVELPYEPEPQGEAIAWSLDGKKFYTLSESTFGIRASLIVHVKDSITH